MEIYFVEKEEIYKSYHIICLFVGNHRCGYIGLLNGHKLENKGYEDIDLEIHGGLTYASNDFPFKKEGYNYYIGFDCAHYDDGYDVEMILKHNPNADVRFYNKMNAYDEITIKTVGFVMEELKNGVNQLMEDCNES